MATKTPVDRIIADNDPRNGSIATRLIRMLEQPDRRPDADGLYGCAKCNYGSRPAEQWWIDIALGNALVPQIAEWIGRRILDYEQEAMTLTSKPESEVAA